MQANRQEMGRRAAADAADALRRAVAARGEARVAFAAAPSQDDLLAALREEEVPWGAVVAYHLDEFLELPDDAPQLFRRYLGARLFDHLPFREVHLVLPPGSSLDGAAAARRYADLLGEDPLDLVCLGIGENGHLAFNDPPVADFEDPLRVKVVELDATCRRQQVADGSFADLQAVPRRAVTLTVPTLIGAREVVCVVPGERKREAVAAAVRGPVTTDCPASALQRHERARIYLDAAAAAGLDAGDVA